MDPRDEARLNDWIEGVASGNDAAFVEAILDADPALAARARAMRADRELLASLETSAVPSDLRSVIDDRVARMLLLAEPDLAQTHAAAFHADSADAFPFAAAAPSGLDSAEWRSRRRKRVLVRRWGIGAGVGSLAAAAIGLFIVLQPAGPSAGVGETAKNPRGDESLASARGVDAEADQRVATAPPFRPSPEDVVVHGLPTVTVVPEGLMASRSPSGAGESAGTVTDGGTLTGPVPAIRLSGLDAATLERRLVALVDGAADEAEAPAMLAFTRNLTTEALARMMPRPADRDQSPLWADLDTGRAAADRDQDWRRRLDERLDRVVGSRRGRDAGAGQGESRDGTVIAGAADQRPGWGDQIVFSQSGAIWTLSIRADRAADALAALEAMVGEGARTGLVSLDPVEGRIDEGTAAWRTVRAELRRLARDEPGRIVFIPLVLARD